MKKETSFEQEMARLEEIASLLESEESSLDDSIKLFEEGTRISKNLNKKLSQAEQKIAQVTASLSENENEHDE